MTTPRTAPLRIGILGAANIAPALVGPAAEIDDAEIVSIAARDRGRAESFAAAHGIPDVDADYDALLARPDIDAVYVPLPAHLHLEWTVRALEAGKHVLCEKPMAMNAAEAREAVAVARARGLILMEGFHYRYHPLIERAVSLVASGVLGELEELGLVVDWASEPGRPTYWDRATGGGNARHAGCYAIHFARVLAGQEPEVRSARADWVDGVDAAIRVELGFPGGARATIASSMVSDRVDFTAMARGTLGELTVENFIGPQAGSLTLRTAEGEHTETGGAPSSFTHQLIAFVEAVTTGRPPITSGDDIVANAAALDAILATAEAEAGSR